MKRDTIGDMGALCRQKHDKWAQHSGKISAHEHVICRYGMVTGVWWWLGSAQT